MISKLNILMGFGFLIAMQSCEPKPTRQWYKGNLHTHTYWSDGDEFPEMVLDWYKTRGYDFIGLSDHNTLARDEQWIVVRKSELYEKSFQQYLEKFGADWVQYKTDTGRTQVRLKTYTEYKSKMGDDNFLIIPSEEITDRAEGKPVHLNATNIQNLIEPQGGETVAETMQHNIDAVLKQRQQTNVPMFPHINHPNFGWAATLDDLISLHGERFFEVYNGHPAVHNYGDSLRPGTEVMWDKINIAYARRNQPLMFGLATDDSHSYHEFGLAFSNAGRGWVMVQSETLQADALIKAMEAGQFYASTGVTLSHYSAQDNLIEIHISEEPGITYSIEFIGATKNDNESQILKQVDGPQANFKLTADYVFVRARITSSKIKENPFQEGDFEMAWTQPVTLSND